ncbi:hypothetical protein F4802DRAFT_232458 [Xylaria palmicola]|nr:hypothetical protein F4802DRAFT_232458 [Xylaria palmicola]
MTMEIPPRPETTSGRAATVYARIFRSRPEARRITKRSSLPDAAPPASAAASTSTTTPAPTPAAVPPPTAAYQANPRETAARRGDEDFANANTRTTTSTTTCTTHHPFQVQQPVSPHLSSSASSYRFRNGRGERATPVPGSSSRRSLKSITILAASKRFLYTAQHTYTLLFHCGFFSIP